MIAQITAPALHDACAAAPAGAGRDPRRARFRHRRAGGAGPATSSSGRQAPPGADVWASPLVVALALRALTGGAPPQGGVLRQFSRRRSRRAKPNVLHAAIYLAHTGFGLSQRRAGLRFQRDRTTVRNACARIEDAREDAALDMALDALCAALTAFLAALQIPPVGDCPRASTSKHD